MALNHIAALAELAGKATPGPWRRSGVRQTITENCIMVGPDGFLIIAVPVGSNPKEHAGAFCDAAFIAACSPEVIKAMARAILAADKFVAVAKTQLHPLPDRPNSAYALMRETEEALKALQVQP